MSPDGHQAQASQTKKDHDLVTAVRGQQGYKAVVRWHQIYQFDCIDSILIRANSNLEWSLSRSIALNLM